ncbi:MAG: glycoside hydrolase family 32 protein [Selenomonadaceae bacterium]|nr:glycoside hydrolase family 32 protein [Selenomonadaceae bacterium]
MRVTNTRWYPKYHVAAPAAWINDPNSFVFYKGQYHLFAQHHPHSAQWGPMHWHHVVSDDLVHWKHLPIALAPTEDYERNGCFSGSGIEKDGRLYLFYTGHIDTPETEELGFRNVQNQCMAYSDDGINFTKYENNPIILVPEDEDSDVYGADFRDPKVWKHGDTYYMVVGAHTKDKLRGQIVLYESKDLYDWNFKSIMARGEGNQGFMWECPNLASVEGKDVLILSPQGIKRVGNKFMNVFQSGYFIGRLDYSSGIFKHGEFELLDYGFDFYAPQITQIPDGRTIMIGWLDMWYSPMKEDVDGWAGMMTVPREVHIKNGKVVTPPIKELEALRISEKSLENLLFYDEMKFDGIEGEVGELVMNIDLTETPAFEIDLRVGGEEKSVITYDDAIHLFKFNRDKAGEGGDGEREVKLPPYDKMKLQIFLDRSSVEIFINDGEYVMSSRIYPRSDSTGIKFIPVGGAFKIDSMTFYTLGEGIPQPRV